MSFLSLDEGMCVVSARSSYWERVAVQGCSCSLQTESCCRFCRDQQTTSRFSLQTSLIRQSRGHRQVLTSTTGFAPILPFAILQCFTTERDFCSLFTNNVRLLLKFFFFFYMKILPPFWFKEKNIIELISDARSGYFNKHRQ